jgi:hypothetical protein
MKVFGSTFMPKYYMFYMFSNSKHILKSIIIIYPLIFIN